MKFPVSDLDAFRVALVQAQATFLEDRLECDEYFNAPHRDFALTDEAVRIRRKGDQYILTYKGPKRDSATKTRTEIEVELAAGPVNGERASAWLQHLGFRAVAKVSKQRSLYSFHYQSHDFEICLDRVDRVGTFVELETVTDEVGLDAARAAVLALADSLGLHQSERRSYLEMWLSQQGQ
jgi:adenylate cyclase class 2